MKLTQKEAVYLVVSKIKSVKSGEKTCLTIPEKEIVKQLLIDGFRENVITLINKQANLTSYVSGLINNWLRKDERLNGNSHTLSKVELYREYLNIFDEKI